MKYFIGIAASIFTSLSGTLVAQTPAQIQPADMVQLQGAWKGSLTYLDYQSGKPYTMPANTNISAIPKQNHLLVEMIYPNETNANSKDTLFINTARTIIDEGSIVSRKVLSNGDVEIVAIRKGQDGNDNKKALIKKTYTIGRHQFINKKDVQFEGTSVWINRHVYSYTR
ncbi:MAG: hypothetical protein Q8K64_07245 [Sediminibacterium sp.]|nr:hypothetical protein [Sediminibacterium sp.]